ncbi:unnamed protein product [Urochloa decumbens]|uniref:Uncharacterized protein n=1 Tax=Urochloa decumbens TaxID=240449 RepID=A0ABC9F1K9_9POAL
MAFLFLVALLVTSSSSSSHGTSALEPTMTFCSGQPPNFGSSDAITTGELTSFLNAVCGGAYGVAHMSHNKSWHIAGTNRTMFGVAQCRPDVTVPDCAACLAAASSHLVARRTACTASGAVWHDTCFLTYYSDRDPAGPFLEDEYTATVFNASRVLSPDEDGKAAVRRLLVAAGKKSTMSSHTCRGVGASTAAGGLIYGLTRCAAGVSCDDCRRCLRGALATVEREYNGSAGMQVLRVSCMARYESYPFYNATSLQLADRGIPDGLIGNPTIHGLPPAAQPTSAHPDGHTARPPDAPHLVVITSADSIGVLLIVFLVSGLAATCIIRVLITRDRRKKSPAQRAHAIDGMLKKTIHGQGEEHLSTEEEENGGRTGCQLYSYQVLESATCHFSSRNKLGSGGFGTVYKGTLENGKQIAVKRLKDSKRSIQELEREISIVSNLCHKNLVRFLGHCFQEEGRFLVYEYAPNNSLEKFLYKACFQSQKLEWAKWFNIIKGVARGLYFLHNEGIIHRDLKPQNILLDESFNPKIADFDLMRVYDKQKTHESTQKVAGTFGYMAPECTTGRKFLLSIKSDVYSYGVLVLEIITGHKINTFEGQKSESLVEYVWRHWMERRANDVVDSDLGLEGQENAPRQALRCVHVALLCVQSDRTRRPTMGQVLSMLNSNNDATEVMHEPSLPGYVVRPKAGTGVWLPCLQVQGRS